MAVAKPAHRSRIRKVVQLAGDSICLHHADALDVYDKWEPPVVIISDGPYGLGGDSDLSCPTDLPNWHERHIRAWTAKSTALTTLWFWNTEIGWATVHPVLARHGWVYRQCCVWDKGMTHAANHTNTRTLRKLPTVTEVCVQYVRVPEFRRRNGPAATTQTWLRAEWSRAKLPFREANRACGCGDMARRRYLIGDRHWYCPPPDVFARLAAYANKNGDPAGRPYFSVDGVRPVTAKEWRRVSRQTGGDWERQRGKFRCEPGLTNVWRVNPVRGSAREKGPNGSAHPHEKPVELMERLLRLSACHETVAPTVVTLLNEGPTEVALGVEMATSLSAIPPTSSRAVNTKS